MVRIESISYWISKRCNLNLGEAFSILEDNTNVNRNQSCLKINFLKKDLSLKMLKKVMGAQECDARDDPIKM